MKHQSQIQPGAPKQKRQTTHFTLQVVAHVCHPNTKADPEFEASLSYTRETLVSIPRPESKVSVRMLMQAFVSLCPAALLAITAIPTTSGLPLLDTKDEGNRRAHQGTPTAQEWGWPGHY